MQQQATGREREGACACVCVYLRKRESVCDRTHVEWSATNVKTLLLPWTKMSKGFFHQVESMQTRRRSTFDVRRRSRTDDILRFFDTNQSLWLSCNETCVCSTLFKILHSFVFFCWQRPTMRHIVKGLMSATLKVSNEVSWSRFVGFKCLPGQDS